MVHTRFITQAQRSTLGLRIINTGLARTNIGIASPNVRHLTMMREYPFDPDKAVSALWNVPGHIINETLMSPVTPVSSSSSFLFHPKLAEKKPDVVIGASIVLSQDASLSASIWEDGFLNHKQMALNILAMFPVKAGQWMVNIFNDRNISRRAQDAIGQALKIPSSPLKARASIEREMAIVHADSSYRKYETRRVVGWFSRDSHDDFYIDLFTDSVRGNRFDDLVVFTNSFCADTVSDWADFFSKPGMPADVCAGMLQQIMPQWASASAPDVHLIRALLQRPELSPQKAGAIIAEMNEETAVSALIGLSDGVIAGFQAVADGE